MNTVQPAAAFADTPNSLGGILEPDAALAAARRMQRWYQTPQGVAQSMFGRDGRRVASGAASRIVSNTTPGPQPDGGRNASRSAPRTRLGNSSGQGARSGTAGMPSVSAARIDPT